MEQTNQRQLGPSLPLGLGSALGGWRRGGGPLYRRLAAALGSAIERQELLPGTKLPPERVLAAHLAVARTTVSAAYELLERRRMVHRRQGRGTLVRGGDGIRVDARAADLTTSLQRNVIFRRLSEETAGAIELLSSSAPPSPLVREALCTAADAVDTHELLSGHGYFPLGYPPLRHAVAAYLTARGLPTCEEEILITGGAQQAVSLLAGYYAGPGAMVVVEDPTFPGALDAFRAVGSRILSVPVCDASSSVEIIASTISGSPVRAVYVMPAFHNPTGVMMPEPARRELARLARSSRVTVIEDNTLAELPLGGQPPPPVAAYGRRAPIVSIGSLSKLFWAGLRVGWIRAQRPAIAQLGQLKAVADLGTSLFTQAIAVNLLADADRVRALRCRELTDRLAFLQELVRHTLPDWAWRQPDGGPSVWVRLPAGNAVELAHIASRRGVLIAPGSLMSPTGGFGEFIRLPFDHEPAVLQEAIRRLASAWRAYRAQLRSQGSSRIDVIV
jgi:DNA-binding transcriptional MocR family regulator